MFLLDSLRFDNKETTADRKKVHPFAAIRDIWNELISMCKSLHPASTYTTSDEQLFTFRSRFRFRMFIPNKLVKYGIKIIVLCDMATKYITDAE